MLRRHNNKGPSATWGRGAGPGARPWRRPRLYFSTPAVALQVYRPSLRLGPGPEELPRQLSLEEEVRA
jgi:hypothetical protein